MNLNLTAAMLDMLHHTRDQWEDLNKKPDDPNIRYNTEVDKQRH